MQTRIWTQKENNPKKGRTEQNGADFIKAKHFILNHFCLTEFYDE